MYIGKTTVFMFPGFIRKYLNWLIIVVSCLSLTKQVQSQGIFPDTIRSCKVDSLLLDAGYGYDEYLWSTGDTTQFIWVSISGPYTLDVVADEIPYSESVFVVIVDAYIQEPIEPITCGDTIHLIPSSSAYEFTWFPDNEILDSLAVYPRDTAYYYANIQDTLLGFNHCIDSVRVDVSSVIIADSVVQQKMGCPDSTAAQVEAFISGGWPPYTYEWSEGTPFSTQPNKAWKLTNGTKHLTVTDSLGCILKHPFEVKAYSLPEIEISSDPGDTVYIQKPFVNFTYQNLSYDSTVADTFYLTSFWWDFLGNDSLFTYDIESPQHIYTQPGSYEVYFHYRTFFGCVDSNEVHLTMIVEPVKLRATSLVTPNGDEFNQYFEIYEDDPAATGGGTGGVYKSINSGNEPIDLSKYFLSNTLVIFNRYGQRIYEADNYKNDWDAMGISDGVYYFILECKGYYEDKTYKGSITVLSSTPP